MRKRNQKQLFFDTARLPKYPTFRASPSEGTAENHLHKNSSQVGCVIGRAHAKPKPSTPRVPPARGGFYGFWAVSKNRCFFDRV